METTEKTDTAGEAVFTLSLLRKPSHRAGMAAALATIIPRVGQPFILTVEHVPHGGGHSYDVVFETPVIAVDPLLEQTLCQEVAACWRRHGLEPVERETRVSVRFTRA